MPYLGCHLSSTKGNYEMVKTAKKIGADTFAFFTRNPRGSKAKPVDPVDCEKAMEAMKEWGFGPLVAHGSYTMNLCTKDPEARAFAAQVLKEDLERMAFLPGQYYNFHPGSHVGQGTETGITQIAGMLNRVLTSELKTVVLLETMTGKGSEIGGRFEELREMYDAGALAAEIDIKRDLDSAPLAVIGSRLRRQRCFGRADRRRSAPKRGRQHGSYREKSFFSHNKINHRISKIIPYPP